MADHNEDTPTVSSVSAFVRLARPKQWAKSGFVFIGPLYATQSGVEHGWAGIVVAVILTALAFCFASSGCYVFNDIADIEADRAHPRKRNRPIASGAISPEQGRFFAFGLYLAAIVCVLFIPGERSWWVLGLVAAHVANVLLYSARLKHIVILDVMSLAMGFVLRVLAGCVAAGIWPSTWLLNVSLFLSMTLAFGKRLGERRTLGSAGGAVKARGVQSAYSDDLLRMLLVVSAVATLLTYSAYVVTREELYSGRHTLNLLWITMLPATYGLLRAILLVEMGRYDDPTEIATRDRPFQGAAFAFVVITVALMAAHVWWR